MEKLIRFIENEIQMRDMSIRAFAELCDISAGQMANVLNGNRSPGLIFLEKLATGTNTPISDLVRLIFPEPESISPEISILSKRIAALNPDDRKVVETVILGLALKRKQQAMDNSNVDNGENGESG